MTTDDIPDLLPKAESSGGISSPFDSTPSSLTNASSGDRLEHLGKNRPKKPKTRAPTRAAIVTSVSNKQIEDYEEISIVEKLDDGLESFFKMPKVEIVACHPQPQPRNTHNKSFEKIIPDKPTVKAQKEDMSVSLIVEETKTSSATTNRTNRLSTSRIEEVTRSQSSPNLGLRKQQQQGVVTQPVLSPTNRTSSPGSDEVANILNRISSPIPAEQHSDLLAELKAKGGKRSLAPTPTPSVTASTEETNSVNTSNSSSSVTLTGTTPPLLGVRLRATAFGDVLKSPSKSSLFSEEGCSSISECNIKGVVKSSTTSQIPSSGSTKQRPKSVVGLLGAKFEMGSSTGEIAVDDVLEHEGSVPRQDSSEGSDSSKSGKIRKVMSVFSGSSTKESTGNSKPSSTSRSKFYTSSSSSSKKSSSHK